jgi:hypothetical protein
MIADALDAELKQSAVRLRDTNPLFIGASRGTLTLAHVTRYVANVHHLIRHTPLFLGRARERAEVGGNDRLAAHYVKKWAEEVGHDVWAERDLAQLSARAPQGDRTIVPAAHQLVAFIFGIIDEDPALYLSYLLFSEGLIALMGDEWLGLLEQRCGIPRTSMTVIGNHVELDRDHMDEALQNIDALVAEPEKLPRMRQVLRDTIAQFERFCDEVVKSETGHDDHSTAHVSAA